MIKSEELNPKLVEKGRITKRQIAVLGDYEIGILYLDSYSKIKKHKHKNDWEIYVELPFGIITDVCDVGKSHELENDDFNPVDVLYIKGKNGVPLPDDEEIKRFLKS